MENKQPEDDLFDRLNVSGPSALGWGGVCLGVAWALPSARPVASCMLFFPLHTVNLGPKPWDAGRQTLPLSSPDSCGAFPCLGWMPAISAGDPRPVLDTWSGMMLTEKDQCALSACLRLKCFLGRCHETLCFGILLPPFSVSHWQSRKCGKWWLHGHQGPRACRKGWGTWLLPESRHPLCCSISSRLLF